MHIGKAIFCHHLHIIDSVLELDEHKYRKFFTIHSFIYEHRKVGTSQICGYSNMKNIQRVSIWDRLNEGWELYLLQVRDTPCDQGTSWNCMWKVCWCSYTPHNTFIGTRRFLFLS